MKNLTINLKNISAGHKAAIMEIVKKSEAPKRWRAKRNESYYCVHFLGGICKFHEFNLPSDRARFNTGNYFKTKEECEEYNKKLLRQQQREYMSVEEKNKQAIKTKTIF